MMTFATLDKETQAKLGDKLVEGNGHIERLEDALKTIESGFAAASAQYGSELAGSDGGDKIREKIRIAKARLAPLKKVILGGLDMSEKASTERTNIMCGLDRAIGILQKEREMANDESHQAFIVKSILEGTLPFVD